MNQPKTKPDETETREVACRGDAKLGTACGRCWRCQERNVPKPKDAD